MGVKYNGKSIVYKRRDNIMIWDILKIEPTKDEKAITNAYRQLLVTTNPEEKPEEFKMLRSAYEEALEYARQEEETGEKTPVEEWADQLAELYDDFSRRIDVDQWYQLLSQDICVNLDTKPDIEEALLVFLMSHYRIPQHVSVYLNDVFHFDERIDELCEKYPEQFVEFILIKSMTYDEVLPYRLFSGNASGGTYDEYMSVYYDASNQPFSEAGPAFEKLAALPVRHPYGEALRCRYDLFCGDKEALGRLEMLKDIYSDDQQILSEMAISYFGENMYEEAIEVASEIVELNPSHFTAINIQARSNAELGRYKEAVERICRLMDLSGGNQAQLYELADVRKEWNEALIDSYVQKLKEDVEDYETAFELCWCYLQNERIEKAYKLLPILKEDYPEPFKYLRTRFLILGAMKHNEEALEAFDAVIKAPYDQESKDNPGRIADLYFRKAEILFNMKKREECEKTIEEALAIDDKDAEPLTMATRFYLAFKNYGKAVECADKVIQVMPGSYHGYLLRAVALFEMRQDNMAFQDIDRAMQIEGGDLTLYTMKLRILVRNNAIEQAEELISFLKENGVTEDILVQWCEAQILAKKEDVEGAMAAYTSLDERIVKEEINAEWLPRFYYLMCMSVADYQDAKGDYSRAALYEILDKGLAADPDDANCLDYKAWLLKKDRRRDEAVEIYEKLLASDLNPAYVNRQLAELYYSDTFNNADTSLAYYEKIAEDDDESRVYHLNVAFLHFVMQNYEECKKHLDRTLEISPDDAWTYYRLAQMYIVQREYDKALECAEKSIELCQQEGDLDYRYWWQKAQVLRILDRNEEAIQIYEECKSKAEDYRLYEEDLYNTYLHDGNWDAVEKLIKKWRMTSPAEVWSGKLALYYLVSSQYGKADKTLKRYAKYMDTDDYNLVNEIISAMKNDFMVRAINKKNSLDGAKERGKDNLLLEYAIYATALWFNGLTDEAVASAEEGMKEYEKFKKQFTVCDPIYYGGAGLCMAVLGRLDEARETVAKMRTCALCDFCTYRGCKDMYLYMAKIEAIAGEFAKARQIMAEGLEIDPGEEMFAYCEAYIRSKEA